MVVADNRFMMIDRRVDFAYGYRMRCESCHSSSWLTAEDHAGSPEAVMRCSACGEEFNFGRAVIDLRDPDDAALDDCLLPQLAWYHTTTDPDWPRSSKLLADGELAELRKDGLSEGRRMTYGRRQENQALHLGTYEAAIESMLRRMRNQSDRDSTFYLHRIRIRDGLAIEPGWRDENYVEAAKVTATELANDGLDVIRYLNAYESMGGLSVAVVRGSIAATQRFALPISGLIRAPNSAVIERMRTLRNSVHAVQAKHANDPLSAIDRIRKKRSVRAGEPFVRSTAPETYDAVAELERLVEHTYLGAVSPVIRGDVMKSVGSPGAAANHEMDLVWLEKIRNIAALVTQYDEVIELFDNQSWLTV